MSKYIIPIIVLCLVSLGGTAYAANPEVFAASATQFVISIPSVAEFLGKLPEFVWEWAPKVIAAFAGLSIFTKNESANKWMQVGLTVINTLALNVGQARNDPAADKETRTVTQ